MSEPREFWIIKETMGQMCPAQALSEKMHDDDIHVIEYSAYETLRTENERLKDKADHWSALHEANTKLANELYETKVQLQSEREKNAEWKSEFDELDKRNISLNEKVTELQAEIESLKKLLYDSPEIQDNIESIKKITLEQAAQKYVNESGYKSCRHRMFLTFLKGAEWFQDKKYEELEAEKEKVTKLRSVLEFYADEKNWYDVNKHKPHAPEIRMVIASIDTTGDKWIGGHKARSVLAEIGDEK